MIRSHLCFHSHPDREREKKRSEWEELIVGEVHDLPTAAQWFTACPGVHRLRLAPVLHNSRSSFIRGARPERGMTFPTSSSLPFLFVPHLLWRECQEPDIYRNALHFTPALIEHTAFEEQSWPNPSTLWMLYTAS